MATTSWFALIRSFLLISWSCIGPGSSYINVVRFSPKQTHCEGNFADKNTQHVKYCDNSESKSFMGPIQSLPDGNEGPGIVNVGLLKDGDTVDPSYSDPYGKDYSVHFAKSRRPWTEDEINELIHLVAGNDVDLAPSSNEKNDGNEAPSTFFGTQPHPLKIAKTSHGMLPDWHGISLRLNRSAGSCKVCLVFSSVTNFDIYLCVSLF